MSTIKIIQGDRTVVICDRIIELVVLRLYSPDLSVLLRLFQ
ncbi:hypothetical protein GM3708_633 [Geminocystis sp. NIES-3708]|nr:hypothetical protein [Geminocystis sp. NIES-3708]BAQ60227.1 hypothetical protein GM3708_633 [Geminocystis sp. NIES-3708]